LRKALIDKGFSRQNNFSINKKAEETLKVYRSVL
jgi:hypothetical protein